MEGARTGGGGGIQAGALVGVELSVMLPSGAGSKKRARRRVGASSRVPRSRRRHGESLSPTTSRSVRLSCPVLLQQEASALPTIDITATNRPPLPERWAPQDRDGLSPLPLHYRDCERGRLEDWTWLFQTRPSRRRLGPLGEFRWCQGVCRALIADCYLSNRAVAWSLQIVPQIYKTWSRRSAAGVSTSLW